MSGLRSRRKSPIREKEAIQVYCRRCMKTQSSNLFYNATDKVLDTNGFMSVCKACVGEMYKGFYENTHNMQIAVLNTCRIINLKFDQRAIDASVKAIETNDGNPDSLMGYYMGKIKIIGRTSIDENSDNVDLTFQNMPSVTISKEDEYNLNEEDSMNLRDFWGDHYTVDDFAFLERELSEWKKSYSCSNKAEEFLLKEVCYKSLELKKARAESRSVDAILKSTQDILKSAALTPAQASAASSGKGNDIWGSYIKIIEETTPAEYYKDKGLFKDFDDIEKKYIIPYILRPLSNFVQNNRDFNITPEDYSDEDYYEEQNSTKKEGANGE